MAEGLPRRAREAKRRSSALREYAQEVIEGAREIEEITGGDAEEFRQRFQERFGTPTSFSQKLESIVLWGSSVYGVGWNKENRRWKSKTKVSRSR